MTTDVHGPGRVSLPETVYRRLRRSIGVIGIGLPVVLVAGGQLVGDGVRGSISAYYYSDLRNLFVGALCVIAVFLWFYRVERIDDRLGTIAGALALLVAFCPTAPPDPTPGQQAVGVVHLVAAGGFFLVLAWFAWFRFPLQDPGTSPTPGKDRRNQLYRGSAVVIVVALALAIAADRLLPRDVVDALRPVLWLETLAVWAFATSWLVKGIVWPTR